MIEVINSPIFWICFYAASDIIGLSPLKSNSVVELVLAAIRSMKPSGMRK